MNRSPTADSGIPIFVSDTLSSLNESPTIVNETHVSCVTSYEGKRPSKAPAYLQDYYCNMAATNIPYLLSSYISYEKLFLHMCYDTISRAYYF